MGCRGRFGEKCGRGVASGVERGVENVLGRCGEVRKEVWKEV